MNLIGMMPPEWAHVLFVLFLSFLIGLEREERKDRDGHYSFGGVRTFPLIGLIGYSMSQLSGGELLPQAIGFAVVGGFLMISYWHKLTTSASSGVTSEMSGLATYLVGAFVYHEMFWIATALTATTTNQVLKGLIWNWLYGMSGSRGSITADRNRNLAKVRMSVLSIRLAKLSSPSLSSSSRRLETVSAVAIQNIS